MAHEIAPLVRRWIEGHIAAARPGHVPLLFISGAQGSGKSTALAEALRALAAPAAGLSLDDVYLTRAERSARAARSGPLFAVRGPPGTHDLALLEATITALRAAGPETMTPLHQFDKASDDRSPRGAWRTVRGRPAAIAIEGWMMGVLPDPDAPDTPPINPVEASDDTDRTWRRAQEAELAGPYAALWDRADGFLHILAPDFGCVSAWRLEQEESLMASRGKALTDERRAWVLNFVQYYERLTRRMLAGGRRQGAEIHIDAGRRVIRTAGL
ncbi:kinase [Hyphomonas sp.]|jgi:D-glycerate 3-kinase|uniref:kinase n=1 Tax=Hyphomonas sp. TaxID=87 RepID=UPI00391BFBEE